MKMDFDISKIVEELVMQATETQEEFIIETIHPYCENILQIKINKEELKQMLLKSMQSPQSCEDWYDVPSDEMTFEQARQAVKDLRKKLAEYLEQQPCEDCISKAAAIDVVHKYFVNYLKLNDDICLDGIRSLPSVTPKPKTGHWISLGGIPNDLGAYRWCSNCDCGIDVMEFHRNHYNFCPNCGVKMGGEDEND